MIIRARVLLAVLFLIAACSLAACEGLPLAGPADDAGPGVDLSDPEVGGGAGVDTGPQTPIPTATVTGEASPRLDAAARATADSLPPTADEATLVARPPTVEAAAEPPTATPQPSPTAQPPTVAPPTPAAEGSPTPPGEVIHIVQPGENLYRIGLQYGLSWVVIAEYNGIADPNAIIVGQEIRIPPAPTATPEAQSSAPVDDEPQTTQAAITGRPSAVVSVAPGDTLYSLAQRHGVSWDQIAEANGLTAANQIYAGQVLKIPADAPGPTHDFVHQVHRGETLTGIARQYGFSPVELAEANGLSAPYVIYPGQALTIPGE
jgi:LysM repeat protein